jgi:hypothetical protein
MSYLRNTNIINKEVLSTLNTTTTPINDGITFTGTGELNDYSDVMVSCKTDRAGVIYFDFSNDGVNWDTFPTNGFNVSANIHEFHTAVKGGRYFRVRLVNNSGGNQTYLRLYTYYGVYRQGNLPLNQSISSDADALITRGVLVGSTDNGKYINVPVTAEGHLEVAIHSPRLPFGSIHTESLTPVFQSDGVYGLNSGLQRWGSSLSGIATTDDASFSVSTGTTAFAQAFIQSRKRLRYRAGQGVVGRFACLYSAPASNAYQLVGFGHAEDGLYFGYKEIAGFTPEFGILYVNRGKREVQTLTVTTGATVTGNCTITLNGVATTVALTNASNINRTVYEIASVDYNGWTAYPSSDTVVFVSDSANINAGIFSFAAGTTGAVATIAQTRAGESATETFIPQSQWNGDKLDGTGASGVTADWQKGNVFEIGIQYLGYGSLEFKVETVSSGSNNADFVTVHTIKNPNTLVNTSLRNPSFPFTMAVYSAGSTTDVHIKAGSFAGFIEGPKVLHGNRFSYFRSLTTVGAANYQALFTVLNSQYYKGIPSQVVVNLLSISGALKHTSPCIYYLIKNGTLAGNPVFTVYSQNSATLLDTAATTVTFTTNDQLLWSGHLGDTGEIDHIFTNSSMEELTLQPGEWVTLAAKSVSGNPQFVTGSLNTREDQ